MIARIVEFAAVGISGPFVQDNHARSADRGVMRGLHLQIAPSAQGKLIRVVRGAIWDVAVDIRRDSPTYLRHASVVLASCWRRRTGSSSGVPAGLLTATARSSPAPRCDLQRSPRRGTARRNAA